MPHLVLSYIIFHFVLYQSISILSLIPWNGNRSITLYKGNTKQLKIKGTSKSVSDNMPAKLRYAI